MCSRIAHGIRPGFRVVAALTCLQLTLAANGATPQEVTGVTRERMIRVPAGLFDMGDGEAYCGVAVHTVELTHHFLLDQRKISTREYLTLLQWALDEGHVTASRDWVRDNLDGGNDPAGRPG